MEILHETLFGMLCEMLADWLHYLDGMMEMQSARKTIERTKTHEVKSHWKLEPREERRT